MARTSTACVAPVDVHSRRVVSVGWAALALVGQQGSTACPCGPRFTPARRLRHRMVGGAACQQHGAFRGASHGRCAHDRDGADAVPRGPTQPPPESARLANAGSTHLPFLEIRHVGRQLQRCGRRSTSPMSCTDARRLRPHCVAARSSRIPGASCCPKRRRPRSVPFGS